MKINTLFLAAENHLAIGNITARHGSITPQFIDYNLPLQGENSVYGRQLKVTLKDGASLCAALKKDSMKTSVAAAGK